MASKIADRLGVNLNPPPYVGKACATCRYSSHRNNPIFSKCGFYCVHCSTARNVYCKGRDWEPIPPRLGFFRFLAILLLGGH